MFKRAIMNEQCWIVKASGDGWVSLHLYHNYLGGTKMFNELGRNFWWEYTKKDFRPYVGWCMSCWKLRLAIKGRLNYYGHCRFQSERGSQRQWLSRPDCLMHGETTSHFGCVDRLTESAYFLPLACIMQSWPYSKVRGYDDPWLRVPHNMAYFMTCLFICDGIWIVSTGI